MNVAKRRVVVVVGGGDGRQLNAAIGNKSHSHS